MPEIYKRTFMWVKQQEFTSCIKNCISEDSTKHEMVDYYFPSGGYHDACIEKGLACQIRINLTTISPSSPCSWKEKEHLSEDNEMSVPGIWAEHTFQGDKSENADFTEEDGHMEEEEDHEYEELGGAVDEARNSQGSDTQSSEIVLKTRTAKGCKLDRPVVSLDNLIAKKDFSEDDVKKLITDTGKAPSDIDPWLKSFAFKCNNCGQKFDKERTYSQHIAKCDQDVVKCSHCSKMFGSVLKLNKHVDMSHGVCKWSCNLCSDRFMHKVELLKHFSRVHDERVYKCAKCNKRFESEENLMLHAALHDRTKYPCTICGKVLSDLNGLRTHMKIHTMTEKPFKCEQCGSAFLLKHNLTQHVKCVHETPLVCKICGISLRGAIASLRAHLLRAHGQKYKYKCDLCDKHFEAMYELQAHKRSHVNLNQCNICGKVFTWKNSYKQHMERHSDTPKYQCTECSRMFFTSDSRSKHIRVAHRTARNFHCALCTKSFKTYDILRHHKEIHENKRRYKCKLCGKGFNSSGSIVKHRAVHEREGVKDVALYCNAKLPKEPSP